MEKQDALELYRRANASDDLAFMAECIWSIGQDDYMICEDVESISGDGLRQLIIDVEAAAIDDDLELLTDEKIVELEQTGLSIWLTTLCGYDQEKVGIDRHVTTNKVWVIGSLLSNLHWVMRERGFIEDAE